MLTLVLIEIFLASSTGNWVTGNFIGTNFNGTGTIGATLSPVQTGISIYDVSGNSVGTNSDGIGDAAERNVISGNTRGVSLGDASSGNLIRGNFIGSDVTGTIGLHNLYGIFFESGAQNNLIGTDNNGVRDAVEGNFIFGNTKGIVMNADGGSGNRISGNSIFMNLSVGIDIGNDDVTNNDPNDNDTGPNGLQNYPVITLARTGSTIVNFNVQSTPNSTFRVEFFASSVASPSGFGEGQTYLGFMDVTTDAGGNFTGVFTTPVTTPIGQFVTTTASDIAGSTSEFSAAVAVGVLPVPTAARVAVGGRVLTSGGQGIYGARVFLTGSDGISRSAMTNPFGFYRFNEVEVGQTYIIQARHKSYSFSTQVIGVKDEILNMDIFADPPGKSSGLLRLGGKTPF